MNNPYYSIIIPVFNRGKLIEKTLQSVLNQTFKNFEIIVVDDGSTDNTAEIVKAIDDERVKYFYQDNSERCIARNNGIRFSKGRYLIFLDSDDFFDATYLEELQKFIHQREAQKCLIITHSRMVKISAEGVSSEEPEYDEIKTGEEVEYFLFHPTATSRMCIHREIAEEFGFDPDVLIVEDQVLTMCVASKYPVYQFKQYLVNYTIHGDNSVGLAKNPYIKRLKGLKKLFFHPQYHFLQKKIKKKHRNHVLAECYFNISRSYLSTGAKLKSLWPLMMSFYFKPDYRTKEKLHMLIFQW